MLRISPEPGRQLRKTGILRAAASMVAGIFVFLAAGAIYSSPVPAPKGTGHVLTLAEQHTILQQTQLADKLIASGNVTGIQAMIKSAPDAAARDLFSSALIAVEWPKNSNNPAVQQREGSQFLTDVGRYLTYAGSAADPLWALHRANFILANLTTDPVNRIEYWSALPADRAELKPAAGLALQLLHLADNHLKADLVKLNSQTTFSKADKIRYMQVLNGQTQAAYYRCFASYFYGLSLRAKNNKRDGYFLDAVKGVKKWASGPASNGVKYPALLLMGKAYIQAGEYTNGEIALVKAESAQAPLYIQYAARYQHVVGLLRAGKYNEARRSLTSFRKWVTSNRKANTASATMGAQLLAYRIDVGEARSQTNAQKRRAGLLSASDVLMSIVAKAPQYQGLIFSHLATELPLKPVLSKLTPIQALAFAWTRAQHGAAAQARQALSAAKAVLARKSISAPIAAEATLIAGISYGRLGRLAESAAMNLKFATMAPDDQRAKAAVNMALSQLQQLNQAAEVSSSVSAMTRQALQLAYVKYHESQWAFAYALQLEELKHFNQAKRLLLEVKRSNPVYLDAQYQLVRITAAIMNRDIEQKQSVVTQQVAAQDLLTACHHYLTIIQDPPPATSAAAIKRAKANRISIMFLQAATALDPLREPNTAGRILDSVDQMRSKLSHRLQGILLRYRIRQYQLSGQGSQIIPLIKKYTANSQNGAEETIRSLIGQYDAESRSLRSSDPAKAKNLASQAALLLQQLIHYMAAKKGANGKLIYAYRQILAQEYINAGHGHKAMSLYKALEERRPGDLRNFIGFARAAYAAGHWRRARRLYVRIIPKLEPGSNLYWTAYLYLIRANEKLGVHHRATVQKLRALLAIYGSTIGGKRRHKAFAALLQKYNIAE